MDKELFELNAILKEMLRNGDMRGPLTMPDGTTSDSITVETNLPGQTSHKERYWPFQVPSGYVRFSGKFDTDRNSGDKSHCDWANSNPSDGTVYGEVRCSQVNGYARAAVSNVYAIRPEAAERLYNQSKNSSR